MICITSVNANDYLGRTPQNENTIFLLYSKTSRFHSIYPAFSPLQNRIDSRLVRQRRQRLRRRRPTRISGYHRASSGPGLPLATRRDKGPSTAPPEQTADQETIAGAADEQRRTARRTKESHRQRPGNKRRNN